MSYKISSSFKLSLKNSGKTIAVLPSGIGNIYPAKHKELAFVPFYMGRWWGANPVRKCQDDIDILLKDKTGSQIIICECKYKNEDFLMITYEMIHTSGEEIQTTNLIFLPPLGIRYFDISVLMPYSVEASNILVYDVHTLWELLLRLKKSGSENIELVADARALTIEE